MFGILRKIYLNSGLYDKKISKTFSKNLEYKPSSHLLSSIIKLHSKKFNINDFTLETAWTNKNLSQKQSNKLNNFFWIFSLDLKSSSSTIRSIITNWIKINYKYNSRNWDFDTTSKRLIAWLSNTKLTYDEGSKDYKEYFNHVIQKQALHLVNQLNKTKNFNNKLVGISAIILVGLSYKDNKNFISKGLDYLRKTTKSSLDDFGFPNSRSINQSFFYLKYLILIREWFKESQTQIPEFIDEHIFYLGQSYAFFSNNIDFDPLFNGNNISDNVDFNQYLKRLGYSFKNENYELSDYVSLKNKKINLIMDVGPSPHRKFSNNYQAGALSFELVSSGKKIFTNCGYHNNKNLILNELSKSSAAHNTLVINDSSSCKFKKDSNFNLELINELKITKKDIIYKKNYWKINAAHDGYLKKYDIIVEREISFFPEDNKFIGVEKLISKKNIFNNKFDIRYHLDPSTKIMKTQDNKSIFIELADEGWKFTCDTHEINIDNGLYFGKKNTYIENQNIYISGITNSKDNKITWELIKI